MIKKVGEILYGGEIYSKPFKPQGGRTTKACVLMQWPSDSAMTSYSLEAVTSITAYAKVANAMTGSQNANYVFIVNNDNDNQVGWVPDSYVTLTGGVHNLIICWHLERTVLA